MNQARALAEEARERRGLRVLELFLTAFTTGRLEAANKYTSPDFVWFGKPISKTIATVKAKTFQKAESMSFAKIRALPSSVLEVLAKDENAQHLFEGSVREKAVIALADVTRGSTLVTVGAVIEEHEGESRVARIFDPDKLKSALEAVGSTKPPSQRQ